MEEDAKDSLVTAVLEDINPDVDVDRNPFSWTKKATRLFLQAYQERKDRFRSPEVKKKLLWTEIAQILKDNGYTNVDEDILDRKMRNMKRTYKTIRDNNRKNVTKRVSWEYYNIFQEIFSNLDSPTLPENKNKLCNFKKQIEIEEKKINIINQMKEALKESNRIQQERNDLIRQLILSQFHSQDK